jgi:hypothetical protein
VSNIVGIDADGDKANGRINMLLMIIMTVLN